MMLATPQNHAMMAEIARKIVAGKTGSGPPTNKIGKLNNIPPPPHTASPGRGYGGSHGLDNNVPTTGLPNGNTPSRPNKGVSKV